MSMKRKIIIVALFLLLPLLALLVVIAPVLFTPGHLVEAHYPYRIEFIGRRLSERDIRYFSVRVTESSTEEPVPQKCPLVLEWRGYAYRVADMTPQAARQIGFDVHTVDYKTPNHEFGFIGGFDNQNRDFGIELSFKNSRAIGFYARFHPDSGCPFAISFEGFPTAQFPIYSKDLESFFGKPERTEEYPYK